MSTSERHNSIHSPKNKYRVEICFDEPSNNLGSFVSFTASDIETCQKLAAMQSRGKKTSIRIYENRDKYPAFDWVPVNQYRLND